MSLQIQDPKDHKSNVWPFQVCGPKTKLSPISPISIPNHSLHFPCGFNVFICVLALFPGMAKRGHACVTFLTSMTSMTCDNVFRYWSLCISHRPAGPIPFEICQPVHHAWELQQILYLVLLVSFCVLWSLSNCHVQHVASSSEFRSLLEQAADAHNVVFCNATSTGPGRRSELGWSARHVASLRPTDLDRLSCSLMVSAALI